MKKQLITILFALIITSIIAMGMFSIAINAASATEFTITYHLDGGTNALKNPEVYTSEDVITLKDATKEGYDFAGWFLDAAKTEQISEISGRTGNLNLYAKFTPKSYTATFHDGVTVTLKADGFEDKIIYLNYGEIIQPYLDKIMSSYLEKVSYSNGDPNFSGWFLDATYKNRVSSNLEITTDTTLYCHFNNKTSKSVSNVFSDTYSNTYYNSFGGATNSIIIRVPTLSNGKVYFTFSCNLHHGYAGGPTSYSSGSFKIWNESIGGYLCYEEFTGGKDTPKGYVSDNITVTPGTVIKITYTGPRCGGCDECSGAFFLSFHTSREYSVIKSSQSITSTIPFTGTIVPPVPNNRNGYSFIGWYDEQGNLIAETYQYTDNQVFVPKWQPTNYYITYNLDGGSNDLTNPSSYTIEDSITLNDPSKAGYTFKGWYSDSDFKTKVTNISNQTGNVMLYAKWEVNSYNLTLDANNGTFAPKVTFMSDGVEVKGLYLYEQNSITAYRPANKDGYIFAGWYVDNSFTNLFTFNGTITEDITLYAKWIECSENIINIESVDSFDVTVNGRTEQLYAFVPLVDGTIVVTSSSDGLDLYGVLYDAAKNKLITADDISDSNLDFSYTYDVKAGQLYYIAVKGTTASTSGEATISVDWTGSCTITGTTYPNRQILVVYDTDYQLPQKPIREGYIFLGWFDERGIQVADGTWNFITDKTLTARWDSVENHIHSYNAWSKYDGNQHVRECLCGEKEYAAHTFGAWSIYDDTQHVRMCECSEKEYADHQWDNGVVTTQPTQSNDGVMTYTCSDCGKFYTETIIPVEFTITSENRSQIGYIGKRSEVLVIPGVFQNEGTWYRVTSIGDYAFQDCSNLYSVTIPDSVTSIGIGAFYNCHQLSCVNIPNLTKSIGAIAFASCICLTSITISDSVENIGRAAFYTCYGLSSIDVSDNNQHYKSIDGVLYTKDLKTLIQYPIGKEAASFTVPNTVTSISVFSFVGCSYITSIDIPNSVTNIGANVFDWCPFLTSINFGDTMQSGMLLTKIRIGICLQVNTQFIVLMDLFARRILQ